MLLFEKKPYGYSRYSLLDIVGGPLAWVLYSSQLGLSDTSTTLIVLKQTTNGILNIIVANMIVQIAPRLIWDGVREHIINTSSWSIRGAISILVMGMIFFPMLGQLAISGRGEFERNRQVLSQLTKAKAENVANGLEESLQSYIAILSSLTAMELSDGNQARETWPKIVEEWTNTFMPELHNLEITSPEGEIIFSYPNNHSGKSKYAMKLYR
ncbi:MAG: hypothetical protein AAED33_03130 [Paracoccaceae bacterium]